MYCRESAPEVFSDVEMLSTLEDGSLHLPLNQMSKIASSLGTSTHCSSSVKEKTLLSSLY